MIEMFHKFDKAMTSLTFTESSNININTFILVTFDPIFKNYYAMLADTFIKNLNKNPFLTFLITVITIGGVICLIASWYFGIEVDQLENKIANTQRGLGGPDLMNLEKVLIEKGDAITLGSDFFEESFYATNDSFWSYLLSNPVEINFTKSGLQTPADLKGPIDYPVHVWYGKPEYTITDVMWKKGITTFSDTVSNEIDKTSIPDSMVNFYGTLQKVYQPTVALTRIVRKNFSYKMRRKRDYAVMDSTNFDQIPDDELLGRVVDLNLSIILNEMPDSNIQSELVSVQKRKGIIYIRALETIKDVEINRKKLAKLYVWKENLIICTKSHLYDIKVEIPYIEPVRRGQIFSKVSLWFDSFAVINE